jgi:hypothetical protein
VQAVDPVQFGTVSGPDGSRYAYIRLAVFSSASSESFLRALGKVLSTVRTLPGEFRY